MAILYKQGGMIARFKKTILTPDDKYISEKTTELTIHQNRRILKKETVKFRASMYSEARFHNWGWKLYKKIKESTDLTQFIPLFFNDLTSKGFIKVK